MSQLGCQRPSTSAWLATWLALIASLNVMSPCCFGQEISPAAKETPPSAPAAVESADISKPSGVSARIPLYNP